MTAFAISMSVIPLGLFLVSACLIVSGGLERLTEELRRIADALEKRDP